MDRTVDYLYLFDGKGNVEGFVGNYSEYLEYKKETEKVVKPKKQEIKTEYIKPRNEGPKKKLSFKEKYELEHLEPEIEKLENEKTDIEKLLQSGETDLQKLSDWGNRYETLTKIIEEKLERWEYLASFEE